MRTTLDIEKDVLAVAKQIAEREGTSTGKVLSRLARLGLAKRSEDRQPIEYRNGVPLLPRRGVIVTNELIDQIREEEGI